MTGFGGVLGIHLDAEQFANDQETYDVAVVVSRHAEKRRARYREKEKPVAEGLSGIGGYWSDTVPWYEWMSEPQVLQPCAEECGLNIWQLADVIAYQIRPDNWQVFSWMAVALQGNAFGEALTSSMLSKHAKILADMREKQRRQASQAGQESGKTRAEKARCTPTLVAKGYQDLMATGTEERDVAAKLALRHNVTADHIRKLRTKATKIKRD